MRKKVAWVLLFFTFIVYVLSFTDSSAYEKGFLVTQSPDISEPYEYKGVVSFTSYPNDQSVIEEHFSDFLNTCIQGLTSQATYLSADGIISLTWKTEPYGTGDRSGRYRVTCQGMAIKRESTH